MNTLQLVTTDNRSFFNNQVETLEQKGINCDVVPVSHTRAEYLAMRERYSMYFLPESQHSPSFYLLQTLRSYPKVLYRVQRGAYDLIHANCGLAAPFALLQPKGPVVQTFWGSDLMGEYLYDQYDHVCKFCAKQFDASIVRNEAMKRKLDQDAHIIPAGVDMGLFEPMPTEVARDSVGWSSDKRHILFPYAPRKERKNYPLASSVIDAVNKRVDDEVVLQTVYGVDHEQIPTYMNASDALILTSRLEGSPNTVKEAMACNLPVVSTDVGDVRERLRNVTPSTVATEKDELVDGLVEVINYDGRPTGREQVKPVSWDRIGDQIIDVYEDVV